MTFKIKFHTNLDTHQAHMWHLNRNWGDPQHIPAKQSRIQFPHGMPELEVVVIRYPFPEQDCGLRVEVELHIPTWFSGTMEDWEARCKKRG